MCFIQKYAHILNYELRDTSELKQVAMEALSW